MRSRQRQSVPRAVRLVLAATAVLTILTPARAIAQTDGWQGSFSPMYLWAARANGDITAANQTVPIFMSFDDAAKRLTGAFTFNVDARKEKMGIFTNLSFVRFGTDADFTIPSLPGRTARGNAHIDNTIFEAGGSYLLSEPAMFAVIAGVRTYNLSTKVEFTTNNADFTPVDAGRTSVNGIVGFTYRPRLREKLTFLSRADIGGGGGFTWSALLGFEYRPKPWAGLIIGYKGLGLDVSKETDDVQLREYDVTSYGPIFALNFHWGAR